MKYCVVKDTTKIIDGSDNSQEIMLQNGINAGFLEEEIEILTEEEYQKRKALEPIIPPEPTPQEMLEMTQADILLDNAEKQMQIDQLMMDNANLLLDSADKQIRIDQMEFDQANILYILAVNNLTEVVQ